MQEKLNESLEDIEEGFSESPIRLATLQSWKKIEGILPLFNEEEEAAVEKEIPKLNLKPLPVELKYTYLEEDNQCPVVISSSLTSHQENCLMGVLKRCKKAIGWQNGGSTLTQQSSQSSTKVSIIHNSSGPSSSSGVICFLDI